MILKKYSTKTLLIFLVLSLGFGSWAFTKSEYFRQLERSQKLFHWVNRELMSKYVDDIDIEAYTKKSIQNMLSELDPYTVFLEAEERDGLDMLTNGKYGGVGIQIGRRDKHLTVIAPMNNSPAQRAGIISGDHIIAIDQTSTKDLGLDEAAKLIRGEKGTTVVLTIERFGEHEPIEFSLKRDDIKVENVAYVGLIDDQVGYLRLTRFSKNAVSEMRQALKKLQNQNVNSIVLDLRDNPGGLLQTAIGVLDLFIEKGDVLLTTKGKGRETNRSYKSDHDPVIDQDIKIAVLINHGSASASEIVAGAIQDLDRGVILGSRSFGKGLVQSVYNFDKKRSLKITTAKYYIPSGRLIQKPNYNNNDIIAWTAEEDSIFSTVGGRAVKGGGGIFPDVEVTYDKPSTLVGECWRKGLFFSFVQKHRDRFMTQEDIILDDQIIADFEEFISDQDLELPISGESQLDVAYEKLMAIDSTDTTMIEAFNSINAFINKQEAALFQQEIDQIKLRLKMEYANLFSGTAGRIEISLIDDPVVNKAIEVLENTNLYQEIFVAN